MAVISRHMWTAASGCGGVTVDLGHEEVLVRFRVLALAVVLGSIAAGAAAPAFADDGWRHHDRGGWRDHEWREREWREHHWRDRDYEPPVVVAPPYGYYAPPPVYYGNPGYYR